IINQGLTLVDAKNSLLFLKANLLLLMDRYDSASKIINDLYADYPNNQRIIDLKGQLDLKQGKPEQAVNKFSSLYAENPTNKYALKWAQANIKNNNVKEAVRILEKHESLQELSSANKALLAELLLEINPEKSKKLYLGLNEKHPNNIAVLNNLAWAYYNLEDTASALPYAEQAYNVSKSSTTLDTYATILLSNDKGSEAVELINHSENSALLNDSLKLTLIESYLATNQITEAKKVFSEFIQISDDLKERYNKVSNQIN
ncbi:MAG: tetratricopeptide repeat protein, partial [Nonlabens ulvanivorans]|uniref:tetratricopeptide repeat protein n=1 Tax=Nonlabens ulvanivorans TaxID=906888 RepID=UPI003267E401